MDVKSLYKDRFEFGPPMIGALLRLPWQELQRRQLAGMRQRGFNDLNEAYLAVFQWPGPQGLRPSELAAQMNMSRQAINHLLGQLEDAGYLLRVNEGHMTRIELTERGIELGRTMRDVVAETERAWAAQIGVAEMEELRRLLQRLSRAVS